MGARADQQLALNFLAAVHGMWAQHPGVHEIHETTDDLVPALAQMCIKALAAELRHTIDRAPQEQTIDGELVKNDGSVKSVTVRDIANKIVHGIPARVDVREGVVRLHFENSEQESPPGGDWERVWFSGSELLTVVGRLLYKHNNEAAFRREREISQLLRLLGADHLRPLQPGP